MDKARKQAEKIPEDKRLEEIQKNLQQATEQIKHSSKELDSALKFASDTMNKAVETAPKEQQTDLSLLVIKSNKLLAQLKEGANVNDIVKQLKALKP
jgi:hypothetical protein